MRHEIREYEEGGDQVKEDMLPEYDFSGGVRGKHARRFGRDHLAVLLDKDVAKVFRTSAEVNEALRALARIARTRRARSKRLAS